jgi:hypothetical protein
MHFRGQANEELGSVCCEGGGDGGRSGEDGHAGESKSRVKHGSQSRSGSDEAGAMSSLLSTSIRWP